jgi:HAD superfamily hydrolase (TIGR01490 family)
MDAAFFDLDKTVIARASMIAFGRPFYRHGLISRRLLMRALWGQLVYLYLGADEARLSRMRESVLALTKGWQQAQVRRIVREALTDVVTPIIYAEALELIEQHRAEGRRVFIVSASPSEIVEPLGDHLEVDEAIASRASVDEHGCYTGVMEFYAYGENKAVAVREVAEEGGYDLADCYAYSDSITDLPMLSAVGHPTAVNPDRGLRKAALERGWPVLQFTRPVSMRARFSAPPAPVVPGAAMGLGAAVVGLAWYARHRALRAEPSATGLDVPGPLTGRRRRRGA